ncbi:unnamed protein product [Gongylonema pulchrum]|uniref:Secreted protein n=1 Tax=Gongylonema pulchrum TaxID=637853 RepID=A0A183E062_9BILA|nr:unnamed protein product [Gongylonema pulchrum]
MTESRGPSPARATPNSAELVAAPYNRRSLLLVFFVDLLCLPEICWPRCLPGAVQPVPLPVVQLETNTNLDVPPLNAWSFGRSGTTGSKSSGGQGADAMAATSGSFGENTGRKHWRSSGLFKDCFERFALSFAAVQG